MYFLHFQVYRMDSTLNAVCRILIFFLHKICSPLFLDGTEGSGLVDSYLWLKMVMYPCAGAVGNGKGP